jgi:hypothetical protein
VEEISPPEREPKYYQCCCVFEYLNNRKSRCDADTGSPDVPFCDECEGRHPVSNPLIKRVSAVLPTHEKEKT